MKGTGFDFGLYVSNNNITTNKIPIALGNYILTTLSVTSVTLPG